MNPKHYLFLTALVPGLLLASCSPPSEPASSGEPPAETLQTNEAPAIETPAPEAAPAAEPMPEAPAEAAPAPAEAAPAEAPAETATEPEWISLFNGENLEGWTPHGKAMWEVVDGVLTGHSEGGHGHIYADPVLTDLEVKGTFRISVTKEGKNANSGLYFRCNPPEDNIDGFPNGYEAQICNSQDAHTGWLWKPGTPTGKAEKLLTQDGEWFDMRVKAVGQHIQIWVKDELVMTYDDPDYTEGHFAIQCHNDGMLVEAKDLFYRDLSK